jgi:hypothetical protein
MKLLQSKGQCAEGGDPVKMRALTLVEMMTTMAVFGYVVIALVYGQIFGLRQDELVESKLGASDQSRRDFGQIMRDMRSAQIWGVGNYSGGTFTPISNGSLQQGAAIQIFLVANNTTNIVYYFDTSTPGNSKLMRIHTGDAGATTLASNLTNYYGGALTFTAEDFNGNPVTDLLDRRVVHFTLGFLQYQYPLTMVGSGYMYDFYKMEFRVTPHVPPGR